MHDEANTVTTPAVPSAASKIIVTGEMADRIRTSPCRTTCLGPLKVGQQS